MEPRLNVIAATLIELGIPLAVDSTSHRKLLQNAIYLAQEAGVDLGYNFAWHARGPYSDELADDYYDAARKLTATANHEVRRLAHSYTERLAALKPVLTPPKDSMSQSDWADLLATVHFLRTYAKQSDSQIQLALRHQGRIGRHLRVVTSSLDALLALERVPIPA